MVGASVVGAVVVVVVVVLGGTVVFTGHSGHHHQDDDGLENKRSNGGSKESKLGDLAGVNTSNTEKGRSNHVPIRHRTSTHTQYRRENVTYTNTLQQEESFLCQRDPRPYIPTVTMPALGHT